MYGRILAAALAVAAAAAGRPLIAEDFEGPVFPPTGWVVSSYGSGAPGGWGRSAEGTNHFASGFAHGGHNYSSGAFLITGSFAGYAGDYFDVHFRSAGSDVGTVSPTRQFGLYKGDTRVWSMGLGAGGWVDREARIGPLADAGQDYTFRYWVHNSGSIFMGPGGTVYLSVDDVVITADSVGVAPESFGRIRSLYR